MSAVLHATRNDARNAQVSRLVAAHENVLAELGSALFVSLPRSDQRRRGMEYLQGLLGARGRKTIRNIAAVTGGRAAEQSLHHFVSGSPWDWAPVRRALARHVTDTAPPTAWVVRSMTIPKAGENSVGVERRYVPSLGQIMNAQQAFGVWAVSDRVSVPVNWRLHLPPAWLGDGERRSRAAIPEDLSPETPADCAARAYLEMAGSWGLPVRPVVADLQDVDTPVLVGLFRAARAPFLVRVGGGVRLWAADPALRVRGRRLPCHQIMREARDMRRPVIWRDPGLPGGARHGFAAAVRVGTSPCPVRAGRPAARGELLLLAVGGVGRSWPGELWLTDLVSASPAELLRLTKTVRRVDRDFSEIAERVGLRDYTGRSFGGWHRHITLASAAHAVAALGGVPEYREAC
ncbi:transposase [Streptomyces sp. TRM 70361]|uniref:IS701 family transposase n=1 Tax=Streptomyces sp. TRM 70361 TaxID=3116553 RepID=UPI002E7AE483|nr:transposase [Streptomyces sp. TRM 70361]MEE1940153.1 transposase [Streptomyces sp. TRM 70361]